MDAKEYCRAGLLELVETRGKGLLPSRVFVTRYASMMAECHSTNSAAVMKNGCCGSSDLIEQFFDARFERDGIDGECITVRGLTTCHNYNLVRIGKEIIIVDGSVAQYLTSEQKPHDIFNGLFGFVGTRRELKALARKHLPFTMYDAEDLWDNWWGDKSFFVGEKYKFLAPEHRALWRQELMFNEERMPAPLAKPARELAL
jgi:hypothetical protein